MKVNNLAKFERKKSYLENTECMDLLLSLEDKCILLCDLLQNTLLIDCKDCL